MDCSLPGSSVHGILQAGMLEWVAILFSRGSSQPRDQTQIFHIAGRFFTIWVAKESQYSERTQVQISPEKRCMVQSPGDSCTRSFQLFSPSQFVTELTSPSSHGGNVRMVYRHQGSASEPWWPEFNWGLVIWTWLTTCMVDLSHLTLWRLSWYTPPQVSAILVYLV